MSDEKREKTRAELIEELMLERQERIKWQVRALYSAQECDQLKHEIAGLQSGEWQDSVDNGQQDMPVMMGDERVRPVAARLQDMRARDAEASTGDGEGAREDLHSTSASPSTLTQAQKSAGARSCT